MLIHTTLIHTTFYSRLLDALLGRRLWLFLSLFLSVTLSKGQKYIKVACIGNSVTFGYGLDDPGHDSYPSQLQLLLGEHYKVGNFGHSGATLLRNGHNPYYKTDEYKYVVAFKPDITIIHLGLNDTDPRDWPNYRNSFEADYATLIDSLRAINSKMQIYSCRLTPIFSGHPRFLSGTRDWYDEIQQMIPHIAAHNQVGLIDLNTPLRDRIDLFDDYLHPNVQGTSIIARYIANVLLPPAQDLKVAETIGSNMVLQRNWENSIYGTGTPAAGVKILFNKNYYTTSVNRDGSWALKLPKMDAGGPYEILVTSGGRKLKLKNILFGDVYLASGQSNMAFQLRYAEKGEELIKNAQELKNLRLFKCRNLRETHAESWDRATLKQVNDLAYFSGTWTLAAADEAAKFSAVAYSFAEQIAKEKHIPIGIVDISVGGSNIESWIDRKSLEEDNLLASYIHNWQKSDFIQVFCRERAAQNLSLSIVKNQRHPYQPAYNFEAGISKWLHTGLKGILWYQGESNAHHLELHAHLFKTLVSSWRKKFDQQLPFYFVQLTSLDRPSWGDFRNSQRLLEKQNKDVHMAVTLDLGDSLNVHPREKIAVGHRLANLVKRYEYGDALHADHPEVVECKNQEADVLLTFNHCSKLEVKSNESLQGFQVVDLRGRVFKVKAKIVSGDVVAIAKPSFPLKSLRYGYEPFTRANLQNEIGTPVSTFEMILD